MADPKLDQLKRVPIFSACSRSELQSLAQNTDEVSLPAQRTLISEGKSNDTFYILLEGEAVATVNGQERRMGPGDIFGEISMLDRGKATATVTTDSPIRALVMSHAQFRDAVRAHEDIALRVISVMAQRLRSNNQAGP
jgi:CRP-like cAMP-binding protein